MKVSGICGQCNKFYQGEACPNCLPLETGKTVNVQMDIPAHFNRGLGEQVNSRSDYRVKCREKGLTEVGNEKAYVMPEYSRKQKEKELDQSFVSLRGAAHQILGGYRWN